MVIVAAMAGSRGYNNLCFLVIEDCNWFFFGFNYRDFLSETLLFLGLFSFKLLLFLGFLGLFLLSQTSGVKQSWKMNFGLKIWHRNSLERIEKESTYLKGSMRKRMEFLDMD